MRFSLWHLSLFVIVSLLGIILLIGLPAPPSGRGGIDPRTGKRIITPWDFVDEARRLGDAKRAAYRLEEVAGVMNAQRDAIFFEALEVLRAELTDPARDEEGEQRLFEDAPPREQLAARLAELCDDREIAENTERFFGVLDDTRVDGTAPDAFARTVARDEAQGVIAVGAHACLRVARIFARSARPRATLRWLLRGLARDPRSVPIRDELSAWYIARNRLKEALAVLRDDLPGDEVRAEFHERRARVAAWLSMPKIEAASLERFVAIRENTEARRRLIQLWPHLGQPERAVAHAVKIAEEVGELAEVERAAILAFQSGVPDKGFALLERVADGAIDEAFWRIKIADYAEQDLRYETAIRSLELAYGISPTEALEKRLEAIYRRRGRDHALALLLETRLYRSPRNLALRREVLSLWASLGNRDRVNLVRTRLGREAPDLIGALNPDVAKRRKVAELKAKALEASRSSSEASPELTGQLLERLVPFLHRPEFREIAMRLALRALDDAKARGIVVRILEFEPDGLSRAEAARLLFEELDHPWLLALWAERAGWADDFGGELAARIEIDRRDPSDVANLQRLAELYEAAERPADATACWKRLVGTEAHKSKHFARLVQNLLWTDDLAGALELLEKRARDPDSTLEQRLEVAEMLFGREKSDQAIAFYRAVLEEDASHPLALLRVGQILSWSNDALAAIPYLERRLEVSDELRHEVEFYLAEAYWATERNEEARRLYATALAAFEKLPEANPAQRAMIARMLVRFARYGEAIPRFAELVREQPDNEHLRLDFADALLATRALDEAQAHIDQVLEASPDHRRGLRLHARERVERGELRDASDSLEQSLEVHGPDAGVLAELATIYDRSGEFGAALDANRRWMILREDSHDAGSEEQRRFEALAERALLQLEYGWAGDDSYVSAFGQASTVVDEDLRLAAALGFASYSGRAAAIGNGTSDVESDVVHIDLALIQRESHLLQYGLGIEAFPGAEGSLPLAAWAGLQLIEPSPFWSVQARVALNELIAAPAAAVGLGGRAHALEGQVFREFEGPWWVSAALALRSLSLDHAAIGRPRDTQVESTVTLGYQFVEGRARVADWHKRRRVPFAAGSPFLNLEPLPERDLLVQFWAAWQASHLLDDGELSRLIPIARRSDYLVAGASLHRHLAARLGAGLESYVGTELRGLGEVWGIDARVTWRPRERWELSIGVGVGRSFGGTNSGSDAGRIGLQGVIHW